MNKTLLTALPLCLALAAQAGNLDGFEYGSPAAPDGTEWQSPQRLALNKEQPRAHLFSYTTLAEALRVLPEGSQRWQSLDGTWRFRWVSEPSKRDSAFATVSTWDEIEVPGCWNVQGLNPDGTMRYGVPIYVNQPVIFQHKVEVDDWRGGVMRTPPTQWTTYKDRNEVGSYYRTFALPDGWKGENVYINFDGIDSFFYLWINGRYVGFSKNSRNTATFNITPYLNRKLAQQTVAVEVYRSSDGSFLEAQDMFRLPGIFRSVYLTARPKQHIADLAVRTASATPTVATIDVEAAIPSGCKVSYAVYSVGLYSDEIGECVATATSSPIQIDKPRLWSAELPYRYVLVATLADKKGRELDRTATYFGARTVQIRDQEFLVNGQPVKLKGVNRHENNPSTGHAITREQMTREVMLMKRANINHVRLSHYSNDPYWYYLSDKYGLYLEDEANVESHEYYYGKASLSHPQEWRAAHVARNMEMVHAHVNHPSIVIWSLGNEAGPGVNFVAAKDSIKAFDTSRPIQYERDTDNGWANVDMGSNQYPSVAWVQQVATGKSRVKYPFHISEFAHSMGNSLGNFADYWQAMESSNAFCGGAIWDWVDQAIDAYTADGIRYFGYGGDHGDWPNDGMFCMNGIMLPDLTPKPQYYEVKKVLQNVGVTMLSWQDGTIEVLNKNYFAPMDCDVIYEWREEGKLIAQGTLDKLRGIGPRQTRRAHVPLPDLAGRDNVTLWIKFLLPKDMPWADKGYVQMEEQFELRRGAADTPYQPITSTGGAPLRVDTAQGGIVVSGEDFAITFTDGWISQINYGGQDMLTAPLALDAFRAPVDNDNWAWNAWFANGLHALRHQPISDTVVIRENDGGVGIVFTVVSRARHAGVVRTRPGKAGQPFQSIEDGRELGDDDFHLTTTTRYTVYPSGDVSVSASIVSSDASVALPRLGFATRLPAQYDQFAYYGRGPMNNYADRKAGAHQGLWTSTVAQQFVPFPKPQSMGNREDVSWCALTTQQGAGVEFVADYDKRVSVSALPWSALEMTLAAHPHELPPSSGTHLHIDCQVTGLGGNSCGQGGPLDADKVKGPLHSMAFIIRPLRAGDDMTAKARVTVADRCPVTIARDRAGRVTINGDGSPVLYTVNGAKKAAVWQGAPLDLRQGGQVTAWYAGQELVKSTATFGRIETVPLSVVFVSSEEGPGGEVAANLVDGDPATIWHTMYSITMGTYPHWIEFDCQEEKTVKGFTYLPRQVGSNGDIRGYRVELSADCQQWTVAAEGEFPRGKKEQRVLFGQPTRARYVRFTALSSQNGDVFASGSEFTVLAE